MFRSLESDRPPTLPVIVDSEAVLAYPGETVLALLLRLNRLPLRYTRLSQSPRGPLCAMGVCMECLVRIDDQGLRPGCLLPVAAGMRITRDLA